MKSDIDRQTDEFSGLSTMFLCVKYNPEALERMLELFRAHGLLDQVLSQKDGRDFNILQFATLNKTTRSLQSVSSHHETFYISHRRILLKFGENDDDEINQLKKKLFKSRNCNHQSALQTTR